MKTQDKITSLENQIETRKLALDILKRELKQEQSKSAESNWIKIPELRIEVEKEVHDKDKSWNDLKLSEREEELLTAEQCIWLANSKYADELKMLSCRDDFFIQQPFKKNKEKGYVAGFVADSGWAYLGCDRGPASRGGWLGVRFCRHLRRKK